MTPHQTIHLLRDLELELLDPKVRKSDRVEELLSLGFMEFGSSGHVFTRSDTLKRLREEPPVQFEARDFLIDLLSPDCAHVRYRTTRLAMPLRVSLRSSLWRLHAGQWKRWFHQGTPVPMPG